ncbi:citrate lyase subunit alpha, partial [Euryarchaeota archaeon ex4484_162]
MKVRNAAGRVIETNIGGRKCRPFAGAKKYGRATKKTASLVEALRKCGLRNGCTISFHHQLRNGDYVLNMTLEAVRELGVRNIRLAQTAMFDVHKPVIEHIKDGIVNRIEGSINGIVGD